MKEILRTNEIENAIDYLEKATFHFNNREDSYWFKWLMISLHGALYGFGVCAVKGISTERVLKFKKAKFEQKKKETVEYYKGLGFVIKDEKLLDSTVRYNLSPLLGIWDILKHCQEESYMMQRLDSKILKITERQQVAITKMIDYRDDFAHFKPRGVSVITEGEGWIVKDVIDVIKFLALESNNVTYFDRSNIERVEQLLNEFKL
ncbi:hypothetical protein [Peribacillus frigoritolerans]|uniref:hypothetical protein n=1 Tax=Peribacillus castrilensis TaxID=2897690 RepID=UPI00296EDB41|nr:hypothetical protein [Peribacillus castrilensis]